MIVKFDKIQLEELTSKRTGNKYNAWVMYGTKRGYDGEPDTEYSKQFFDTHTTTINVGGVDYPDASIVGYLTNEVKQGDDLYFKMEKNKNMPRAFDVAHLSKRGASPTRAHYPREDGSWSDEESWTTPEPLSRPSWTRS